MSSNITEQRDQEARRSSGPYPWRSTPSVLMAKRKKKNRLPKRARPKKSASSPAPMHWMDEGGMHMIQPGLPPSPEQIEAVTEEYQKQIRNSPIWDTMVEKYGEERAKEMLKEFRYKVTE